MDNNQDSDDWKTSIELYRPQASSSDQSFSSTSSGTIELVSSASSLNYREQYAYTRLVANLMLTAWRRKSQDVKRLIGLVEDQKKMLLQSKDQMQWYTDLVNSEQAHYAELKQKMSSSMERCIELQEACKELKKSLVKAKAEKKFYQESCTRKDDLIATFDFQLAQAKRDLYTAWETQRNLQATLCRQQRSLQWLDSQKDKFNKELNEIIGRALSNERKYRQELQEKDRELEIALKRIDELEQMVEEQEKIKRESEIPRSINLALLSEKIRAEEELNSLKAELRTRASYRLETVLHYLKSVIDKPLQVAQVISYLMMPAYPQL